MNNYDMIRSAIFNKHQVEATYKGYLRKMCPHVLGKKDGVEQCLFYQFGGESSSGGIITPESANWRCIPIAGLTNLSTKDGEWFSGEGHSQRQTCVDEIDVEVNY